MSKKEKEEICPDAPKIMESYDYGRFKVVKGNRVVDKSRVAKIVQSVHSGLDLLKYNPIMVTDSGMIVDGQHRYHACMKLEYPVYYVVVPDVGLDDIAYLNNLQKSWTVEDYLHLHCESGNKEYIRLRGFKNQYGIDITSCIFLLSGQYTTRQFKSGHFTVTRYETAIKAGKILLGIRKKLPTRGRTLAEIAISLNENKEYNHQKMVSKLESYPKPIEKRSGYRDYLRLLETIYNYKTRGEPVRFF